MFSQKQRIILICAAGAAVVLLIGFFVLISCMPKAEVKTISPAPSSTATASATPTASPSGTPSLRPTETPPYRLPLVPYADETASSSGPIQTPTPTPAYSPTPSATEPVALLPSERRSGRFDASVRDFLAVGTQNDEPIAILCVRLAPPELTVLSVPCRMQDDHAAYGVQTLSAGNDAASAEKLSEQIDTVYGLKLNHVLMIDLSCLEQIVETVAPLSGGSITFDSERVQMLLGNTSKSRAYEMGALGIGAANLFLTGSPWMLPTLQRATKGKLYTDLGLWELMGLATALRNVSTTAIYVLPTGQDLAEEAAAEALLLRIFC